MVAQKTFVAGDILSASDTNTYLRGGQEHGYAAITASSSAFTSEADITSLTVTWTAISTRVYHIEFNGLVESTIANDQIGVYITDSSNVHVAEWYSGAASGANRPIGANFKARLTGLSGSVTYKIRAQRVAGTGTTIVSASSVRPASIAVYDLGAA